MRPRGSRRQRWTQPPPVNCLSTLPARFTPHPVSTDPAMHDDPRPMPAPVGVQQAREPTPWMRGDQPVAAATGNRQPSFGRLARRAPPSSRGRRAGRAATPDRGPFGGCAAVSGPQRCTDFRAGCGRERMGLAFLRSRNLGACCRRQVPAGQRRRYFRSGRRRQMAAFQCGTDFRAGRRGEVSAFFGRRDLRAGGRGQCATLQRRADFRARCRRQVVALARHNAALATRCAAGTG